MSDYHHGPLSASQRMFHRDNLKYKLSTHQNPHSAVDYCCSRANGIDLSSLPHPNQSIEVHNMEMYIQEEERGRRDNKIEL